MAKPIDHELLLMALCRAAFSYSEQLPLQQAQRPMRAVQEGDSVLAVVALRAVRTMFFNCLERRSSTGIGFNFEQEKHDCLNTLQAQKGWSLETRNLLSSAVSIYMDWDRKDCTIKPQTRERMGRLARYTMFMLEARQADYA